MKHKTFATEQAARNFQAAVDRAEGLPRQESPETGARRIGLGPHVPWDEVWTRTHAEPRKHPSRDEWAYPVTEAVQRHAVRDVEVPDVGTVRIDTEGAVELDETWEPEGP